jgi:hypothetical protein
VANSQAAISALGVPANNEKDQTRPKHPSKVEADDGSKQLNWSAFMQMPVRWTNARSWSDEMLAQDYGPEKYPHDLIK